MSSIHNINRLLRNREAARAGYPAGWDRLGAILTDVVPHHDCCFLIPTTATYCICPDLRTRSMSCSRYRLDMLGSSRRDDLENNEQVDRVQLDLTLTMDVRVESESERREFKAIVPPSSRC